jgi:F0F1-type ATP synthase assembly protein I
MGAMHDPAKDPLKGLIPSKLLRIVAIWSLIPSYIVAGGAIGFGLDRWFNTFPFITCIGILVAFSFAVHDMLRLKKEW